MTQKRYRIETGASLARDPPVGRIARPTFGPGGVMPPASVGPKLPVSLADAPGELERLAVELHAMRDAITTTKREMSDLRQSPSGADGMHRAASELDAVSSATEQAATTILGAVEEIEAAANLLKATQGAALERNDPVAAILERVLVLYEACNFQDIAGQRIRKVVQTLQFVEQRLERVISVWDLPAPARADTGPLSHLSGPRLPQDEGHVSQSDVDAYFG